LTDESFINKYKTKAKYFTRKPILNFKVLTLFIFYTIQRSIQRELDMFFKEVNGSKFSQRVVSQVAFSLARHKIKPDVFVELNNISVDYFYSNTNYKKWNGHRLIAIDGSTAVVPNNKATRDFYKTYSTNLMDDNEIVLVRLSKAQDVLNKITIDTYITPLSIGEHSLAKCHIENCWNNDLLLFDRGYPSFELFTAVKNKGAQFCTRLAVSNWNVAKKLVESQDNEITVEIKPSSHHKRKCKERGLDCKPIKCRFIKIELDSGEQEVLITSLTDQDAYPYDYFKELYHLRWYVEESFKKIKHVLLLENFSGKSPLAIQQDFYAKTLYENFTSILSFGINEDIKKTRKKKTKYEYQINFINAFSRVKEFFVSLFYDTSIYELVKLLRLRFLDEISPIRPDRKYFRKNSKRPKYYRNYLWM